MRSTTAQLVPAVKQVLALLEPAQRPPVPQVEYGYLDLLGNEDPTGAHPGQRLMLSSGLALIYERLWRPLGGSLLMGAAGPGMHDQRRIALRMLDLTPNDRVLDVACGPGNFTRDFACAAGKGLVVGLDASRTSSPSPRARLSPPISPTCAATPNRCPFATAVSMRSAASPRCT